jgi:lactoylglutathione lyase
MAILHTCLNVADADRTADWYRSELGFEYSWEFSRENERNVYVADEDGTELQLCDVEGQTPGEAGDLYDHVAVGVEDVDAAFERIDNHGVVAEPTDAPEAGARIAFIEDPDGHVVELVQSLD